MPPLRLRARRLVDRLLGVVVAGGAEARGRVLGERPAVPEVPAHDELALGVLVEPALALVEQLVDLCGAYPVVLAVVGDRQQHVDVRQKLAQSLRSPQRDVVVASAGIGLGRRLDLVAERLEQALGQLLASAERHGRDVRLEKDRRGGQLGLRAAAAAQSGPEHARYRHAQERRRDVRAVVDVVAQHRPGSAHQRQRVDVEQQHRGAARLLGRRIEHVRAAEGQVERLQLPRALVQQVPEVGRRLVGGRDRQQHVWLPCPLVRAPAPRSRGRLRRSVVARWRRRPAARSPLRLSGVPECFVEAGSRGDAEAGALPYARVR